jgi:hypothetical protein
VTVAQGNSTVSGAKAASAEEAASPD